MSAGALFRYDAPGQRALSGNFVVGLGNFGTPERSLAGTNMKRIVILVAAVALLALPGGALAAGSSTCQSYNAQLCQVASNTTSRTTSPSGVTSNTASTLPFTGLDVGLLVAGGGVLLGAGLLVRRLSREVE